MMNCVYSSLKPSQPERGVETLRSKTHLIWVLYKGFFPPSPNHLSLNNKEVNKVTFKVLYALLSKRFESKLDNK